MIRRDVLIRVFMLFLPVDVMVLSLFLVYYSSEYNVVAWTPYCLITLGSAYFLGHPIGWIWGRRDGSDYSAAELARIVYAREVTK